MGTLDAKERVLTMPTPRAASTARARARARSKKLAEEAWRKEFEEKLARARFHLERSIAMRGQIREAIRRYAER